MAKEPTSTTGFAGAENSGKSSLPDVIKNVIRDKRLSPEELDEAARKAAELHMPQLAEALQLRAKAAASLIASPWGDVSNRSWTHFCAVIANGHKPETVSSKGFYGLFQLSVRRLCDLSIMAAPRSTTFKLPSGAPARKWEGKWLLSQDRFLSDPKLQYKLFRQSMEQYRTLISAEFKSILGAQVAGQAISLSGMLAVAHTAGGKGLRKWLVTDSLRRKFPWVTAAYTKANRIF